MNGLLLDTCAMIFLSAGEKMLASCEEAMARAFDAGADIAVSPYSGWEVGMQAARGKFVIAQNPDRWFDAFVEQPGVKLAPLSPAILIASSFLPGAPFKDPADRIIAATARECGYALVTRDRRLLEYADAGHLRAIPC